MAPKNIQIYLLKIERIQTLFKLLKKLLTFEPKRNRLKIDHGSLVFLCNICETENITATVNIDREIPSCSSCQSTVRMRQLMYILSMELFKKAIPLPGFPIEKSITGIGMSDWSEYGRILKEKFSYENTYYTEEPKLDITNPPTKLKCTVDFLISTDVFEHVNPPVQRAFMGAQQILKSGGLFIFSVPYCLEGRTHEHFPELEEFEIIRDEKCDYLLKNRKANGEIQIFDNLTFHGGPGQTLEMRVFSEQDILTHLKESGFTDIKIWKRPFFEFGIYNQHAWSLPITCRKV